MIHLDVEWLSERLPEDIPEAVWREAAVLKGFYLDGLAVYSHPTQHDSQTLQFQATNEDDLLNWQFKVSCERIGFYMAMRTRSEEKTKWRYPRVVRHGGQVRRSENREYVYDAVYDSRKAPFEVELRLLKPVLADGDWRAVLQERLDQLNSGVNGEHWVYDPDSAEFKEK